MTAFSEILRGAKSDKGWSNRRLARESGLSPATVDTYMRDQHGTPDEPTIEAFHRALGVPLADLRRAAAVPAGEVPPYSPPPEANRLSQRQRGALDELIRAIVVAYEEPFEAAMQLLRYLVPEQLREIAESATSIADELDGDRERVYHEPTNYADREAFMEALGFHSDDDDWWVDDVDALTRVYAAIIHEWGFREREFREALETMPRPHSRPTPESHYREFYERFRAELSHQDSQTDVTSSHEGEGGAAGAFRRHREALRAKVNDVDDSAQKRR